MLYYYIEIYSSLKLEKSRKRSAHLVAAQRISFLGLALIKKCAPFKR
jgi:hypothetical protein